MEISYSRGIVGGTAVVMVCLVAMLACRAQEPSPIPTINPSAASALDSSASMDAERAQIWNSPNMLRARAWLKDYCHVAKKFPPEKEKKYMTELQNMTATQMKLWLMKFDHEQEVRQQRYAMWKQAHAAGLARAAAADKSAQASYAAINREENEAAGEEQHQVNEQQQAEQNMYQDQQADLDMPYEPYGAEGIYGPYPGYGGVHYHIHLYPY